MIYKLHSSVVKDAQRSQWWGKTTDYDEMRPPGLGHSCGIRHVEMNRAKSEGLPGGCSTWANEARVDKAILNIETTGKRVEWDGKARYKQEEMLLMP